MSDAPTTRSWFRFNLSSIFWLVLTIALAAAALREHNARVRVESLHNSMSLLAQTKQDLVKEIEQLAKQRDDAYNEVYGLRMKLRPTAPDSAP